MTIACDICGGIDQGNTCCDDDLDERQFRALARYMRDVIPEDSQSTAEVMLALWTNPDSVRACKYAVWQLHRARRAGCDVIENQRVMESLEMVAAGW